MLSNLSLKSMFHGIAFYINWSLDTSSMKILKPICFFWIIKMSINIHINILLRRTKTNELFKSVILKKNCWLFKIDKQEGILR